MELELPDVSSAVIRYDYTQCFTNCITGKLEINVSPSLPFLALLSALKTSIQGCCLPILEIDIILPHLSLSQHALLYCQLLCVRQAQFV